MELGYNLSRHKRPSVRDRSEAAEASLRFIPPYSPDFNPIKKAFSRLKTMLRKARERSVSGLWNLISKLIDIQPRMRQLLQFVDMTRNDRKKRSKKAAASDNSSVTHEFIWQTMGYIIDIVKFDQ